jgi:hypothetical protein
MLREERESVHDIADNLVGSVDGCVVRNFQPDVIEV